MYIKYNIHKHEIEFKQRFILLFKFYNFTWILCLNILLHIFAYRIYYIDFYTNFLSFVQIR